MRNNKNASAKHRSGAVPVLSAAGLSLSLASGPAVAAIGGTDPATPTTPKVVFHEEEVSDVSLATFYVFAKESAPMHRPWLRFAQAGMGCAGCAGCGGCGCACGSGLYYNYAPPIIGEPNYPRTRPIRPAHKHRLDRRNNRP